MSLPPLLPIGDIQARLEQIFPPGLDMRQYLTREMAARTVYVFLYGGMIEGVGRLLRPSHIYFYTEEQAAKTGDEDREYWFKHATKPGWRPEGRRWYADTTREPIRDETIRYGLLDIGAVDKVPNVAVTSSSPIYYLKSDFAALFNPSLNGSALDAAIQQWQRRHLTPAARARMAMLAQGLAKRSDEVHVRCPDGTVARLSPGLSSLISKAVVEEFAQNFLPRPVLLWLSESGNKVRHQDVRVAQALGLRIDAATALPDIILANVGDSGEDTALIFIEVVASDGPMNEVRKTQLLEYVKASGFPTKQCYFGTAFEDRADSAFRKALPTLAWGTFAWFRSEPKHILMLFDRPFPIVSA
ncbi:restriction endonuclease [Caldimonas thermodepolymerans]|uniref:Restriction endonuclease n=1 Tax=Caldimonas thermodepolymerans TaxID=215580 RepID=A0A2S5T3M7_9BURK|nr:BsuBI/PstI family type II restriction endonuclease [Caldimonas thermodepolymerans]PPE69487.1 restriction endonuclease [Caldimonas thermodepolymerans]QPC31002.1 restriction endonuclease [Caldimonas thermodepolymerans]RDH96990.1 BsuBI/PstI restriction endonuclease [Caldimonas thermodepolymerans]